MGPKEIPSRLIPRLLVLFTRQLEILVTTLFIGFVCSIFYGWCELYFIVSKEHIVAEPKSVRLVILTLTLN